MAPGRTDELSIRSGSPHHEDPNKMNAVMWEGNPYEMAVRKIDKPRILDANDAIIRVTSSAICGTDLHIYHGVFGSHEVPYPVGHEAVGYVCEVGAGVKKIKVGQRVIVPGGIAAAEPLPTSAPSGLSVPIYGLGKDFGDIGGCQGRFRLIIQNAYLLIRETAEFVRCPLADESLTPVNDNELDDRDILTLSDIWPTSWAGLSASGFEPGDSVVVFGAGPVGLLCAYNAILRGASTVISIDHVHARLEKAKGIGAIPVNFAHGDVVKRVLEIIPEGAQRVIDCVGEECLNEKLKPEQAYVINKAIQIAGNHGGVCIVGGYVNFPDSKGTPEGSDIERFMSIDFPTAWTKSLRLESMLLSDPNALQPTLMRLLESGRAKPGFVFSGEYAIEDAPTAYRRFDKKQELKVSFRFPWIDEERARGPCLECGRH